MAGQSSKLRLVAASGALAVALALPVAASAQIAGVDVDRSEEVVDTTLVRPTTTVGDEVFNETVERRPEETEVLGEVAERDLAVTGADFAGLGAIAAGSLAIGAASLKARRRLR